MSPASDSTRALRFPGWEIRPAERALLVRGEAVKIGGRAFDVLLALVERRDRVVGKQELLEVAWPSLVVEENNLSVQITTLRKLLGAPTIVTVSGIGYRLAAPLLEGSGEDAAPPASTRPPAPALIGRDAALRSLRQRLGVEPLITIVGSGGVGKTALARALLASSTKTWRDGLHWIDLAPVRERGSFAPMIAKALGIALEPHAREPVEFAASLHRLEALIAVDNCEHRIDEVSALVRLALQAAPRIRWLATSQEPLHLPAETVYRLEPLEVPQEDADLDAVHRNEALMLFVERVRSAGGSFEPTARNVATAAEICRQLDGLPLAIEMAAARVATLGLNAVREQLGQRLRMRAPPRDAPPRHHTLLQTYGWSYELLTPVEQQVFRRLQTFLGGFTTALMLSVCCRFSTAVPLQKWEALDALSALVDKSLVQRSASAPDRFYLLESARDYACLQATDNGEDAALRRCHAEAVLADVEGIHRDYDSMRDADWIARYVPERHNLQAALGWAVEAREADILARLVAAMALVELSSQAQTSLAQWDIPHDVLATAALPYRARAYLELGWAHHTDGNRETGARLIELALSDFDAIGDESGTYISLARLVRLCESRPGLADKAQVLAARMQRMDTRSLPLKTRLRCTINAGFQYGDGRTLAGLQELHEVAQRAGFDALAAVCRTHITDELLIQCRFEEAAQTCRAMLEQGELQPRTRCFLHHNHALALVHLGRVDEAKIAARAVVRAMPSAVHLIVDLLALAAARAGQFVDAALMAGYSEGVKRERALRSDPAEAAAISETLNRLHDALGAERLSQLMQSGAVLSTDRALAIALPD